MALNAHVKRKLSELLDYHETSIKPENWDFGSIWCGSAGRSIGHAENLWDNFNEVTSRDGEAAYFGLPPEDLGWLFYPFEYYARGVWHFDMSKVDLPLQAKRIRAYLEAGGIPEHDPAEGIALFTEEHR